MTWSRHTPICRHNFVHEGVKHGAPGDLSKVAPIDESLREMRKVAGEFFRVLKPGRYCAILIGDTRIHRHYVPIAFRVIQELLDAGFILKEDIIKVQWKMKATREKWAELASTAEECWVEEHPEKRYWTDFYMIKHEHLFVFRKPASEREYGDYKESCKWWGAPPMRGTSAVKRSRG